MKIALYHNLTSGGSKREAFEFARQLIRHGHTVDLYYPATADEKFLPLAGLTQQEFRFDLQFVSDLPLRFPGLTHYFGLMGWAINLYRLRHVAQQIAARIDAQEYAWVFLHHDQIVQSSYLLRFLKTPRVYYCNEPMREFYEPLIDRPYLRPRSWMDRAQRRWDAPTRAIRNRVVKTEDQQNVRCASLLLTNSFFSAESIYRAYGLGARVVYLGVDAERFRPLGLERQDFVLSVGAVSPLKGYDFLIQALGQLPANERPRLVIVGNTASTGEVIFLKRLAEQVGVIVEFRVNVTDDELVRLYNTARAFVYSPVLEPFGFTPLEAMACQTPVVAVKEGGVRESVRDGETGCLSQRDPRLFAEAMRRVLSDTQFAHKLGANGRQAVLDFWTWDQAYARLMDNIDMGLIS